MLYREPGREVGLGGRSGEAAGQPAGRAETSESDPLGDFFGSDAGGESPTPRAGSNPRVRLTPGIRER